MTLKHISEIMREAAQNPPDDRPFRRGFQHGYGQALDDVARAMSWMPYSEVMKALNGFHDSHITPWRNAGARGNLTPPPAFSLDAYRLAEKEPE